MHLGLQHVAGPGEHKRHLGVGHQHHGLEAAQVAVGAPVLGELDAGTHQLAGKLFELGFESFKQREGVGGGSREAGDHVALGEPPNLLGVRLHHGLAEAHLSVAADHRAAALLDEQDGGGVHHRPVRLRHLYPFAEPR